MTRVTIRSVHNLRLSDVQLTRGSGSVISTDDASPTIDSFLRSRSSFTKTKENKLKLWQSICVELGLVIVADDKPVIVVSPPNRSGKKSKSKFKKNKNKSKTIKPIIVPTPVPMPLTLTQARNLLRQSAHVNINDYLSTRLVPIPRGYRRDLSCLLYATAGDMVDYTVLTANYTPKKLVKDEWSQPLMRDMGSGWF